MSTVLSAWLGVAFVGFAVVASVLQAWLWSYPMDPPNDPRGRSLAPRLWVNLHRTLGVLYVVVYVLMMTEMLPRLWRYQVELPARTVVHAVMAITIGVMLLAKISIIRFFQHFGKALPAIGLVIVTCTIILATLSVPFALRAQGLGKDILEPGNRERVRRVLGFLDSKEDLTSASALGRGREILTTKCTSCHDMRTVLLKPRSGKGWYEVVSRMQEKPSFGVPLQAEDVPFVTAYLVALTPSIQESIEHKVESERERRENVAEVQAASAPAVAAVLDLTKAKTSFEAECSECHKLAKVDKHGKDDADGWRKVVMRMIEKNDAEIEPDEVALIVGYLAATRGK